MKIDKIYVDSDVRETPLATRVLNKLRGIPFEFTDETALAARALSPAEGKRSLWITRFKGPFLKPCPGTDASYLCCNYWVLNIQANCPWDCTYCILQGYLNQTALTLYANLEIIPEELDRLIERLPGRMLRIGTGELTDSLALDPLTGFNTALIQAAKTRPVILEFKTKTDFVGHLPPIATRNVVVSWSLNPARIVETEEHKTAPVRERLEAAARAAAKGYRLGFHFDPLLDFPGWEEEYAGLIRELFSAVNEEDVAWISLGSLRFPPPLKPVIERRFPRTRITSAEMVRGTDGKLRYFRPVRTAIYRGIYSGLRSRWKEVLIYFCMENKTVWKEVMGFSPPSNEGLDYLFHENFFRRFPDLGLREPHPGDYLGSCVAP
ncbi:MAG: hypothetical protein HY714_01145 [Candidatus Omnitrophica bacterium]|nr:hypothetical protein [Candidatus Omnitrophota bacterium]